MSCNPGKRRMYRCYVPGLEGVWAPAVHSNCRHNELAALGLRTMGPTPEEKLLNGRWHQTIDDAFKKHRIRAKQFNLQPWSLDRVAQSYKGRLGRRYAEARASLETEWLNSDDVKLSAFLKGEKFNPLVKVSKPRMICPRSPRYNLLLASYLKPYEHALWNDWVVGHKCEQTRVSGKGLNGFERAELIRRKMETVGDCTVFEVDGKAFEAHVTKWQLSMLEHPVYKAAYPGDQTLAHMLRVQEVLSGKTAGGTRFARQGCRASGDFNTGLGNTLLMGTFVICAMECLDCDFPWTVLADGDNCLLFVDRLKGKRVVDEFAGVLSSICSHEMTVEKPVTVLEQVVFGQSKPCFTEQGYKMVRDPFKVISGAFCGYRHFHDKKFAPRLIRGIAQAELSLARGLPLLDAYFGEAERLTRKYKEIRRLEDFLEGHLVHLPPDTGPVGVSMAARTSFDLAWGIGPDEQVRLERLLVAGLRRDFNRILDSGHWLSNVVEVMHGKVEAGGYNTQESLFVEAL